MAGQSLIYDYFRDLDFPKEVALIYEALHLHGPQTISELARTANVQRIQIYRLLDSLKQAHLIEVEMRYKRNVLRASPIDNLRVLIAEREGRLTALKSKLPQVEALFSQNITSPATRVNMYAGPEGIRQMLWSQLKAQGEIVCYNYFAFEDVVGKPFIENWAKEFEKRKLQCRLVYGDAFRQTWQLGQRIKGMEYYYLSPEIFNITHPCDIYDNVTAYYHWRDKEVFGLEIHNAEIAQSQRQIFELLCRQAIPETQF
ncbi:MAG: winged helix-turn-helix domain-containing protein [Candidatus Saccharimonadales bacterium]